MRAAKIANEKPDTGVEIKKKGAYFLIKDSSDITIKYLAHLCYSSYDNPVAELKGKFTESDIISFVGRAKKEAHAEQLLHIIMTDIGSAQYSSAIGRPVTKAVTTSVTHDYSITDDEDVYGDYDAEEEEESTETVIEEVTDEVDIDDATAVINKLIQVFNPPTPSCIFKSVTSYGSSSTSTTAMSLSWLSSSSCSISYSSS